MNLQDCLDKGYLVKEKPDDSIMHKEMEESIYDYTRALSAFRDKDYKWTIIKCYYSSFHAAKAVCFKLGYREKKHIAVLIMLEDLQRKGKLESHFVNYFRAVMSSREGADYRYTYSKEIAEQNLKMVAEFNARMKELINRI